MKNPEIVKRHKIYAMYIITIGNIYNNSKDKLKKENKWIGFYFIFFFKSNFVFVTAFAKNYS